jgi:uncharacterized glyoxalase superfamily protein PhnB
MKKRIGEPWLPAAAYGRLLPVLSLNLIVADVGRSVEWYREVLEAFVHYSDEDFAAIKVGGTDMMLHADHTYEGHPWHGRLASGNERGLGAEIRLMGIEPDEAEQRARAAGTEVIAGAVDKAHGWREAWIADPDGYVWAVGVATVPNEQA